MSEEIIKLLDYIGEKFGIAIDWTQANALPYAQKLFEKYISYEVWTSVFWIVAIFILLAAFVKFAMLSYKKMKADSNSDWDIAFGITTIIACIIGLIAVFIVTCQCIDIITCATFPEKIVMDLLKQLTN